MNADGKMNLRSTALVSQQIYYPFRVILTLFFENRIDPKQGTWKDKPWWLGWGDATEGTRIGTNTGQRRSTSKNQVIPRTGWGLQETHWILMIWSLYLQY